jgi:hypothetical protein
MILNESKAAKAQWSRNDTGYHLHMELEANMIQWGSHRQWGARQILVFMFLAYGQLWQQKIYVFDTNRNKNNY